MAQWVYYCHICNVHIHSEILFLQLAIPQKQSTAAICKRHHVPSPVPAPVGVSGAQSRQAPGCNGPPANTFINRPASNVLSSPIYLCSPGGAPRADLEGAVGPIPNPSLLPSSPLASIVVCQLPPSGPWYLGDEQQQQQLGGLPLSGRSLPSPPSIGWLYVYTLQAMRHRVLCSAVACTGPCVLLRSAGSEASPVGTR